MRFGNDMITFEEAVAYLKDMPRFTVKKNPADSRDLKSVSYTHLTLPTN